MIVILEGVDGSGKTTLKNTLMNAGYDSVSVETGDYEFDNWMEAMLKYEGEIAISDRSFVTDLVYRICDDEPRRGMNLAQMCGILSRDVVIIHCESGSEFDDAMIRGEDNIRDVVTHTRIKFLYRDVISMLKTFVGVPIIKYNWRTDDVAKIINTLERRKIYAVR